MKSIKNKIDYCTAYRIEIFYSMSLIDVEMTRFWVHMAKRLVHDAIGK